MPFNTLFTPTGDKGSEAEEEDVSGLEQLAFEVGGGGALTVLRSERSPEA